MKIPMDIENPPVTGYEARKNAGHLYGDWVAIHQMPSLNFGDKGFHRELTSQQAFTRREMTLAYSQEYKGKRPERTIVLHHDFWESRALSQVVSMRLGHSKPGKLFDPMLALPRFHHANLHAFYEAVGYDPKKKKYVRCPRPADYGEPVDPITEEELIALARKWYPSAFEEAPTTAETTSPKV